MASFGKYLLDHRVVTPSQLDEATHSMVVFGGRLGTHLVELGALSVDDVERHLAKHLGVALPSPSWVAQPERAALEILPLSVVKKYQAIALRVEPEKRTLHVALQDPRDPGAVDAIAFAAGLRVAPYVLSENRIAQLLEKHYRIPRDARFAWLARQTRGVDPEAAKAHSQRAAEAQPGAAEEIEHASRERESLGISALGAHEELIDDHTFAALHESWQNAQSPSSTGMFHADPQPATQNAVEPSAEPTIDRPPAEAATATHLAPSPAEVRSESAVAPAQAPSFHADEDERDHRDDDTITLPAPAQRPLAGPASSAPAHIAALESCLTQAEDREHVAHAALGVAQHFVQAAAIFVVGDGVIQGIRCVADGLEEDTAGIIVPRDAEGMFSACATRGEAFRGATQKGGLDERVLRALRRNDPLESIVFPVKIRGRVVNLIYADNGPAPLPYTAVAALAALCELVSSAYERLILARKRRHC